MRFPPEILIVSLEQYKYVYINTAPVDTILSIEL